MGQEIAATPIQLVRAFTAFANDGLRNVKISGLRKKLNKQIAQKLGVNLDFEL